MQTSLELLDITPTEAETLEQIILAGQITASDLIAKTGNHRKVIYDVLKKLAHKNLVSSATKGRERLYSFTGPAAIDAFIQEQKKQVQAKKDVLTTLKQEISELPQAQKLDTVTLLGKSGVRIAIKELIEMQQDYDFIGAPKESVAIMGEDFWEGLAIQRKKLDIHSRAIFNPSLQQWSKKVVKNMEIRFFQAIEPLAEIIICEDKVFTIIWIDEPITYIVRNKTYAQSQKQYFELLWTSAAR